MSGWRHRKALKTVHSHSEAVTIQFIVLAHSCTLSHFQVIKERRASLGLTVSALNSYNLCLYVPTL